MTRSTTWKRTARADRSPTAVVAALVALALVVAACGGGDPGSDDPGSSEAGGSDPGSGEAGGSDPGSGAEPRTDLVIAASALPSTFNYDGGSGSGKENEEFQRNNNAGLIRNAIVRSDVSGELEQDLFTFEPELAESYEVSDDGLVYTFHLRRDVVSAAGNPFTADDVIWSYHRKWDAPTATNASLNFPAIADPHEQFEKIDDYTVAVTIDQPGYGFTLLSLMANNSGYIYDSVLLQENATPDDPLAVEWSLTNANHGFGPYNLTSFTPGQEMVLEANPSYVLGEPAIKKVTYRVVQDPATRANAVRTGDADIAQALRPVDRRDLAGVDGVKTYNFAYSNFLVSFAMTTTKPPFDDVRVRQAMAYAIPYDQILENVYQGDGADRRVGYLNPSLPGYTEEAYPEYAYDPDRAKELLAEAGYPDGLSLTLTVPNYLPDIQDSAVQVQSFARDAGFDISLNPQPLAAFIAGRSAREYDAWMQSGYAIVQSPTYVLRLSFRPGTGNTGWEDPAYYAAIDAGNELPDPVGPGAFPVWAEAERIRLEAMPIAIVAAIQPMAAFRSDIQGFYNRSDNALELSQLSIG